MKKFIFVISLFLAAASFAQQIGDSNANGWRDKQGRDVPTADDSKVVDGFGGIVLVTSDVDWKEKWETPSDTTPVFNRVKEVHRGKKLFVLIFFANPLQDSNGQADVSCDIDSTRPNGTISTHQTDIACFKGLLKGDPHNTRLATRVIGFVGDPGDPAGEWQFHITLRDNVRHVALPLKTSFVLLDK